MTATNYKFIHLHYKVIRSNRFSLRQQTNKQWKNIAHTFSLSNREQQPHSLLFSVFFFFFFFPWARSDLLYYFILDNRPGDIKRHSEPRYVYRFTSFHSDINDFFFFLFLLLLLSSLFHSFLRSTQFSYQCRLNQLSTCLFTRTLQHNLVTSTLRHNLVYTHNTSTP